VDKSPESFHNLVQLSTVSVDNSFKLWIKIVGNKESRQFVAFEWREACG
jgi:hypothetical protein